MKKKGLSTVVTTLIIILLVLVAIGMVWVVISNLIREGTEQISLGKFTIDLDIKNVNVQDVSIDVKVKRNPGKGELTGLKFLVSDGVKTEEFEKPTTMGELAEQTFTLDYAGLVKEISIAPILKSDSGKEFVGNEIDKEEFSGEEVIKNINGLVSWWRLEGNANDEVGGNNGVLNGGIDCNVYGKFGKACSFDGVDDFIDVNDDNSLDMTNEITICSWFKIPITLPVRQTIVGKSYLEYELDIYTGGGVHTYTSDGATGYDEGLYVDIDEEFPENDWLPDKWYYLVYVLNGAHEIIYVNGINIGEDDKAHIGTIAGTNNLNIGKRTASTLQFNGQIDEVMIFNKALSEDEVKALYELDLS